MANSVTKHVGGKPGWGSVRAQVKPNDTISIKIALKDSEWIGRPSAVNASKHEFMIRAEDFRKAAGGFGNHHFHIAQLCKKITSGSRLDDFFYGNPCSLDHIHDAIGNALRDLTGLGR